MQGNKKVYIQITIRELEADDLIEIHGMASYRATLESSGWKYIHTRRKWSKVK